MLGAKTEWMWTKLIGILSRKVDRHVLLLLRKNIDDVSLGVYKGGV